MAVLALRQFAFFLEIVVSRADKCFALTVDRAVRRLRLRYHRSVARLQRSIEPILHQSKVDVSGLKLLLELLQLLLDACLDFWFLQQFDC